MTNRERFLEGFVAGVLTLTALIFLLQSVQALTR